MRRLVLFLLLSLLTSISLSALPFKVIEESVSHDGAGEVRVIHITDLHLESEKRIYQKLAEKINELAPDLLLISGDSVVSDEGLPLLERFLKALTPDITKYAVLGNWEYWGGVSLEQLKLIYSRYNCRLLLNEGEQLELGGRTINIFGVDDLLGGKPSLAGFTYRDEALNLVLAHCPAYFDEIVEQLPAKRVLVFSGHTHGGEVTFFGSPIFLPPGSGDYVKGLYHKGEASLYLSKGIGTSKSPVRIFARPDIFYITIKQ